MFRPRSYRTLCCIIQAVDGSVFGWLYSISSSGSVSSRWCPRGMNLFQIRSEPRHLSKGLCALSILRSWHMKLPGSGGQDAPDAESEKAKTKETKVNPPFDDALMMAVSTPLTFGGKDRVPLLKIVWGYLGLEGACMLYWIWFRTEGNDVVGELREQEWPWKFYIAIYVTVGIIFKWTYIIWGEVFDGFDVTVDRGGEPYQFRTTHKVKDVADLPGLLQEGNYNEAMEVIAFKFENLGPAALVKYVEFDSDSGVVSCTLFTVYFLTPPLLFRE